MSLRTNIYHPPAPLAALVDVIWVSEAGRFEYSNIVLPMLHHEWLISFSDRFDIEGNDHHAGSWVSGLQTKPLQTITSGKHFTAGVLFKPGGLSAFIKTPVWQLKDMSVDAGEIFGKQVHSIVEQIVLSRDAGTVFKMIESFLLERYHHITPPLINYVIQRLEGSFPEDGLIGRIAKETNLSVKTLIISFKQYVGVTPAKYHHLVTLRRALPELAGTGSLTSMAHQLQFSDQSHFNHFFKRYTGITPSAYRQKIRAGKMWPSGLYSIEN